MAETTGTTQPALLFIPDISGFTQFVNQVEMNHGQAIIQELLETLIESNQTGMKVSEIEGDAILFYRLGKELKPEEIAAQCKTMFIAFHQQLRRYDMSRICDCGACVAACVNSSAMLFTSAKISQLALLPQGGPERESRVLNMVAQMDKEGFGACTFTRACEATCPKGISISNIALLNQEYLVATLSADK
jgi:ferredoxin